MTNTNQILSFYSLPDTEGADVIDAIRSGGFYSDPYAYRVIGEDYFFLVPDSDNEPSDIVILSKGVEFSYIAGGSSERLRAFAPSVPPLPDEPLGYELLAAVSDKALIAFGIDLAREEAKAR